IFLPLYRGSREPRLSLPPVLQPWIRSAPAFSPPGRGSLPSPCVTVLSRGAVSRFPPRGLRVAAAAALHRVLRPTVPPARTCTSQWCAKPSPPAPEHRPQEP